MPKTAEMIFEGAQAANNRYVEDIPLMKKVTAELDAALAADDQLEAWLRVQKACRLFNTRWKSTPTWTFVHKPLRDIKALARDMAAHGNVQEQATEIKTLAKASLADRDAQRKLRSLLKDAAIY
jgi:hypothetical protein